MQSPPSDTDSQLEWLLDRAQILDVMAEYTRCIDTGEFEKQAELLCDDGYIELPFTRIEKSQLPATAGEHFGAYGGVQHQFANPLIEVHGDEASLRCNFEAVVVHGDPGDFGGPEHADVGGVYEVSLRREGERWRIARVKTVFLWTSGQGLPGS